MTNNCKYLTGSYCRAKLISCPYMSDPQSCPSYEEPLNKPYHSNTGKKGQNLRGITVVEILIVLAILGILAAIVVPNLLRLLGG